IGAQFSGSTAALVTTGGNVGIGTTGPVNALDIYSGQGIHIQAGTPTSTAYALYNVGGSLYWNGAALGGGAGSGTVNSGTQYQMAYYASTGTAVSGNSAITTDASNNLLASAGLSVGTSAAPGSSLTIYNVNESTTMTDYTQALTKAGINIVTSYTDTAYTPGVFWSTADNNSTKPKAGVWMYESSLGSNLLLGTSGGYATGITNTMTLNYAGFVGIGSTAPQGILDILSSSGAIVRINTDYAHIMMHNSLYAGYWSFAPRGNGPLDIAFSTSDPGSSYIGTSGTYVSISTAGLVGIKTTSPAATLDVNGYAKLKLNSSLPVSCVSGTQGSIALTSTARMCVCDTSNTWSDVVTGAACSW
ncbi:MAG: hypothetical protein PHE27_07635, partial [Alphaproteobacteria bacterium]|nr:hypothetical protein [Alphaproteobacteria bacterium]